MPYRWNGFECDTADELLRLKSRFEEKPQPPSSSRESSGPGFCSNPGHRDDCSGRKESCAPASTRCCGKDGDCNCDCKP